MFIKSYHFSFEARIVLIKLQFLKSASIVNNLSIYRVVTRVAHSFKTFNFCEDEATSAYYLKRTFFKIKLIDANL